MKISSDQQKGIEIIEEGLLDRRATGKFIDQNYARKQRMKTKPYRKPIQVYNVDGTLNKQGTIRSYVDLDIEVHGRRRKERLMVTGLGKQKIILGYTWLKETNPIIDWQKGTLEWRRPKGKETHQPEKRTRTPVMIVEEEDEDTHLNSTQNPINENDKLLSTLILTITDDSDAAIWINSKITTATKIKAEINAKKKVLPVEEQVPKEFHEYLDIFSEEKANRFPKSRPWDHKIETKDTFVPISHKTYNLTPQEQIELDKFLKENLEKGYIRPSQSPMASRGQERQKITTLPGLPIP